MQAAPCRSELQAKLHTVPPSCLLSASSACSRVCTSGNCCVPCSDWGLEASTPNSAVVWTKLSSTCSVVKSLPGAGLTVERAAGLCGGGGLSEVQGCPAAAAGCAMLTIWGCSCGLCPGCGSGRSVLQPCKYNVRPRGGSFYGCGDTRHSALTQRLLAGNSCRPTNRFLAVRRPGGGIAYSPGNCQPACQGALGQPQCS